ncbi:MAG: hypothetical protein Fur006_08170 [Coleofasciculaceae cyanobacterium]
MQLLAKDSQEVQKVLSKIVAKTWLDDGLKEQFLTNTNAVLEENGLTLPSGVEFRVNENTLVGIQKSTADSQDSNVVYEISLPTKPTELTDRPIQSWSNGNNSDSSDADYEEGDCRITL